MSKIKRFISLDTIFAKLNRDLGFGEIQEVDIIEWAGEALGFINVPHLLDSENHVVFLEVNNFQVAIPSSITNIIQIARDQIYKPDRSCKTNICIKEVIEEVEEENPEYPIPLDCDGKPLVGVDVAYYRPYFDLKYESFSWLNSNMYQQRFTPVRLGNHSFFGTIVCDEVPELYTTCTDEYTIINKGTHLRFSFQEGFVAVACDKYPLDENGFPLIPDDQSFIEAVSRYITYKVCSKKWMKGVEGFERKMHKAESDWHWYCGQAKSNAMIPNGVDEYENLLSQRQQLLPRQHRYYGFFGNLSSRERKIYNRP